MVPAKVTKVTWTKGQGGSRLPLGGKAVLGEGCRASCDSSRDACFLREKKGGHYGLPLVASFLTYLASIMIPIFIVIAILVMVLPGIVAISVCFMAIAVSISLPSYLPAAVPTAIIGIVDVSAAVISVVVIPHGAIIMEAWIVILVEPRVVAEARLVGSPPFPIFPLALTVEPVVLDVVVAPLGQPLPVIRIVRSVIAAVAAVSGIRIILIAVLCASRS